jgi:putative hydrolase of the HAD superfamily
MMIKIVSFDADGTLVDKRFMDLFWNRGIPTLYAKKNGLRFEEAKVEVEKMYLSVGEKDVRWYLPDYWFSLLGLEERFEDVLRSFEKELRVYPEAKEVLEEMRQDYNLIVISNAPREILEFELRRVGDYFDYSFSSTTDFRQVRKTPEVYRKILKKLGVRGDEVVHVGDHWDFDYLAPREAGIRTYYLDRLGKEKGEDVVEDLREFHGKVTKLKDSPS